MSIVRADTDRLAKRDTDLSDRQSVSFMPTVAGRRVWVRLVGGAYDGKLVIVSHREEEVRLDGLVYLVGSKRCTGMGLPRRAHYLGATIA